MEKNKKIKFFIDTHLLSRILKSLKLYYYIKWDTLNKLDVLPSGIISIAIRDLRRLIEIEQNLYQNTEYKKNFGKITQGINIILKKIRQRVIYAFQKYVKF